MSTPAIPLQRLRLTSQYSWLERLPHFISLTKPRVMALALFTAFVGLMIAPVRLEPLPGVLQPAPVAPAH
ncbi:heme O synthase-like polyprenyltransferase [Bradyrhizobium elkanii]